MLDNLTLTDFIILGVLAVIIIFAGIILLIFLTKKNKKSSVLETFDTKEIPALEEKAEEKKPDVKISLATDNIPQIEEPNKEITKEEPNKEIEIPKEEVNNEIEIPKEEIERPDDKKMDEEIIFITAKETEQDSRNKTSIEEVLKALTEDLDKEKIAKIDEYEEEQDREAVISYQELRKKMMSTKEEPIKEISIEDAKDYEKEFFEILDRNETELSSKEEVITEPVTVTIYDDEPIFEESDFVEEKIEPVIYTSSEFISPIFGRQEQINEYPSNTEIIDEEKKTNEILPFFDDTDEFLNTLKEFRKGL
ncbi:MAG: hypothetical protein RSH78_00460 [Bacilli bacterium]